MPTDSSIFVRSCPARPTNGFPCRSSSSPGPSPMTMRRASGWPLPKTIVVRPWESLQRVHPALAASARRRAADEPPRGSPVSGRSRIPRPGGRGGGSAGRRPPPAGPGGRPVRPPGLAHRATQLLDAVEDELGHFDLATARERDDAPPAVEQDDLVVGHVEADVGPTHVVRDDEVRALRGELGLRVLAKVVRLGGEPYQ